MITPPPAWTEAALCAQIGFSEFWFPEKGESNETAKRVCFACEARLSCLQEAIDRGEEHGVWGGLSVKERRAYAAGTYRERTCVDCGTRLTGRSDLCRDCVHQRARTYEQDRRARKARAA